jgi:hypothetical protein
VIARSVDLSKYDAMTTISGDGLFWELVNGLLMRPDWQEAVKVPVSVMPGGSGNALAFAAGMGDLETAAFSVVRGRATPLDIATVRQAKHRFMSFIVIAWGIVADVDFESERFRWMGGARFSVSAVQRIASLRHYKGKFWYFPDVSWKKEKCVPNCTRCLPPRNPGQPVVTGDGVHFDAASVNANPFSGLEIASLPPGPATPLLDALDRGVESGWVIVKKMLFFCEIC